MAMAMTMSWLDQHGKLLMMMAHAVAGNVAADPIDDVDVTCLYTCEIGEGERW